MKFKEEEEDDDGKVKGQVTGKVKEAEQKSGQKKDEVNVTWEHQEKEEELPT